jgi:hypothetical protein
MLELASYGLTGLAVIVVIGFCLVCNDELPPAVEESSFDLISYVHLSNVKAAKAERKHSRFKEMVGKQRKLAPASSPKKAGPVEIGSGDICSDGFKNNQVRIEVVHG